MMRMIQRTGGLFLCQKKKKNRERKEKIEKLKEEKRQMEEELDDLKGNTKKGKAVCALVGILAVVLLLGGITVLIKTDAGGFASSSLAPLIGDVPVARSILPKHLQRKTAKSWPHNRRHPSRQHPGRMIRRNRQTRSWLQMHRMILEHRQEPHRPIRSRQVWTVHRITYREPQDLEHHRLQMYRMHHP